MQEYIVGNAVDELKHFNARSSFNCLDFFFSCKLVLIIFIIIKCHQLVVGSIPARTTTSPEAYVSIIDGSGCQ